MLEGFSLLKNCKFYKLEPRAAAGTTDLVSDTVDMAGFDSVLFFASTGDATSGTVLELQVFGNTADSVSSPTPVELTNDSAQWTATSSSDTDNALIIVDIPKWNATYRYGYATLVIDTQNCECDGIYAIQYNARDVAITQTAAEVVKSVLLITP